MFTARVVALIVLVPELALACPRHVIHGSDLHLTSPSDILFMMIVLTVLGLPLGIWSGKLARRFSSRRVAVFAAIAMAGAMALAGQVVWACHGYDLVSPFLKQVHAEQMKYHKIHGAYATSFHQLGLKPASDRYSYFLPGETLPAKNSHPKEGLDLTQLPEGVSSVALSDRFTVVALSFKEPDRLDIWTFNETETFREWSVAAFPKLKEDVNQESVEAEQHEFTEMLNNFQHVLMSVSMILGVSLGFVYSLRNSPNMTPASL